MTMRASDKWVRRTQALEVELMSIYLAAKDPRVPWLVKVVAAAALGYQFSPVQVIPDWVPALGLADNFLALAIAAALVRKATPPQVLLECRQSARAALSARAHARRGGAAKVMTALVLLLWLLISAFASLLVWRLVRSVL
jgi:uncharacterized membrane protein YkvA (DUF1232 family)